MGRKYIDCREVPSESGCTIAISADTESELLEAAVQHAAAVHGHRDGRGTRAPLPGAGQAGELQPCRTGHRAGNEIAPGP